MKTGLRVEEMQGEAVAEAFSQALLAELHVFEARNGFRLMKYDEIL